MSELEVAGLIFMVALWIAGVLMLVLVVTLLSLGVIDKVRAESKHGDIWKPDARPDIGLLVFLFVVAVALSLPLYVGVADILDYLRLFR